MILRSALLAGLFALKASSFLVPLEVAKEVGSVKAQVESLWTSNAHTLRLLCPGCTFLGPAQDGLEYSESDANAIEIKLLVDDESSIQINGQPVFSLDTPISPPALTAPQVRLSDSAPSRPLRLGYALEVLPPISFPHDQGEIITLQLTILELEGAPVHVDTVKIDLLKNVGGLSLAKSSTIPFAQSPGASQCTTSLCRFRAIIVARVRAILEAAKARAHATGAWVKSGCRGKKNGGHLHGQEAGHRDHHHHHKGHGKMHRFGHILRQTLRFFIIPALLGVIGGVMASAVGMLVGQALVFLWFRFHRGGQRGNTRVVEVAVVDDEKDALVGAEFESEAEAEMLPPRYEDVEAAVGEDVKE